MSSQRPFFPFWFGSSGKTRTATAPPAAPTSAPMPVDTQNVVQPTAAIASRPSRSSSIEIAINPSPPSSPTPTTSGNVQIAIFTSSSPSTLPRSPQRALRPDSPSAPTHDSSKGGRPISPSKDSRTTIQEPTVAADKDRPNSAVSEQESQAKQGTEYEGDNVDKGQTIKGASFKHDAVEAMSSISSQIATTMNVAGDHERTAASPKPESPIVRGEHRILTQSDEKQEEVVQETNTEANKEIKTDTQQVKEAVQETNTEANEAIKTDAQQVKEVAQETNTEANEAIKTDSQEVKEVLQETNAEANEASKTDAQEVKDVVQETNTEVNEAIKRDAQGLKEVVQETSTEANEATKTEACESLVQKSGKKADSNENTEIPRPDQMQKQDDLDKKELLATSFPVVKPANDTPQPKKSSSSISDGHNKSVPSGGDQYPLQKDIRNYISRFVNRMATRDLKNSVYDKPGNGITLSGQNNGALMQIGPDPLERQGYNARHDQSIDADSDRDGISAEKRLEDAKTMEDQPEVHVNNNAQGINNSIVFNGSITERNPGVHMAVVTHVIKEPIQSADKTSSTET